MVSIGRELILILLLITLGSVVNSRNPRQDCIPSEPVDCSKAATSRYRTHDGSCNNVILGNADYTRSAWGKAYECYNRFLPASYGDIWGDEMRKASDGSDLPNPREVSNVLFTQLKPHPSKYHTQQLMNFGQVLANEITYTAGILIVGQPEHSPCCPDNSTTSNGSFNFKNKHPKCASIELPKDDPYFSKYGQRCTPVIRSEACETCKLNTRIPKTMRTVFIDFGNLYSNNKNDSDILREFVGGKLRMHDKVLPKLDKGETGQCGPRFVNYYPKQKGVHCYQSGDSYSNNNAWKITLIMTFAREHNRLAEGLKLINPFWSDEQLFQEARKIVGALQQQITYKEWLPAVLGPKVSARYDLNVLKTGFTKYNSSINPTMPVEFSSSAMRSFGHSIISDNTYRTYANGTKKATPLSKGFHYLERIARDFDAYNRGENTEPMELSDLKAADVVRNLGERVSKGWKPFGLDFVAVDLVRGRDHGVAPYTAFYKKCTKRKITSFDDLSNEMSEDTIKKLRQVYKNVKDIDLYVGALAEHPSEGSVFGKTLNCLFGEVFYNLKFGDRYYFEHSDQAGSFTTAQLNAIRKVSLSSVFCHNADNYKNIQPKAFWLPSDDNPIVPCSTLPYLDDLTPFYDTSYLPSEIKPGMAPVPLQTSVPPGTSPTDSSPTTTEPSDVSE